MELSTQEKLEMILDGSEETVNTFKMDIADIVIDEFGSPGVVSQSIMKCINRTFDKMELDLNEQAKEDYNNQRFDEYHDGDKL